MPGSGDSLLPVGLLWADQARSVFPECFQIRIPTRLGEINRFAAAGQRIGKADPNWPDWYAKHTVAEHDGTELPT
jgi:hypothetical protein